MGSNVDDCKKLKFEMENFDDKISIQSDGDKGSTIFSRLSINPYFGLID